MILEAYNQRLRASVLADGASPTPSPIYASWVTIAGTTSQVINAQTNFPVVPSTSTLTDVVGYADGSTAIADPNRMRKITTISMRNATAVTRTVQFSLERSGSPGWTGTYEITPIFSLESGGMLYYSPETGWVIYDARGSTGRLSYFP